MIGNNAFNAAASIVQRVRAIAQVVAEHGDAAMAEALLTWLAADGSVTLEAALGLPPDGRNRARLAMRDELLIDLARRRFPTLAGRALAAAVSRAGHRYAASAWPRDRRSGRRPDGLTGDLFDILSLGPLPGEARLRQIFNGLGG